MKLPRLPALRRPAAGRDLPPGQRRLRRAVAALALGVLLSAGAAGSAWYERTVAADRDAAARACLTAAGSAAQAIFSYDYRTFDASVANGNRYVTGGFAREYAGTTASLRSTARTEQAVVQAQVSAVGIVSSTGHSVTVLVYLNQYRRNTNITGEKVDQSRVVLTMVRAGTDWKVSGATAL